MRLRLRDLAQLFNSLDPSPFRDRDLNADAEEFIVRWAQELPARSKFRLVIQVDHPPPPQVAQGIEEAVRHYFANRVDQKQNEFRQLLRRGRRSLIIGLLFLAGCLVASEVLASRASTLARIIGESLIIVGWVAMWRPLEIYLYDWWPLREQRTVLEKLARMPVRLEIQSSKLDRPAGLGGAGQEQPG